MQTRPPNLGQKIFPIKYRVIGKGIAFPLRVGWAPKRIGLKAAKIERQCSCVKVTHVL